ncbi:hypothetical protein RR48_09139 [Papilio machaon]|uniref:Uncharacterized protein n=1 Tax=Papilio machaon TaxID=76193 RepID=A0A194RBY6_PAPMA|nr:hypothetical protein RR48_09139 [Papilio machaon]
MKQRFPYPSMFPDIVPSDRISYSLPPHRAVGGRDSCYPTKFITDHNAIQILTGSMHWMEILDPKK